MIALAASTESKREIVGLHIGPSEAEPLGDFLQERASPRGLRGVRLVISNAREGPKAAIRRVVGPSRHRCGVRWMRDAMSCVPKEQQSIVSTALRQAFI